jgi:hypothetical protein
MGPKPKHVLARKDPSRCYKPYLFLSASFPAAFCLPETLAEHRLWGWQKYLSAFEVFQPVRERFNFSIKRPQHGRMASLTQLDGRSPLMKLGQKGGLNFFELFPNPLLVFFG